VGDVVWEFADRNQRRWSVRSGEIFGIGGVDGNGQLELAEQLAQDRSVGYIPGDRHHDGLALDLSINDNLLIGPLSAGQLRIPWLGASPWAAWQEERIAAGGIKVRKGTDPVSSLSGGNQQKVVVERTLAMNPRRVVAVNPTRGLDIKATQLVRSRLRDAAKSGAAVILISTDSDELTELATSVRYLSRGVFVDQIGGEASGS
jgi:simple sugar transport system ATP-binding protein